MKINIRDLQKKISVTPAIRGKIRKAVIKACSSQGKKIASGEVTICLVNNKKIKELNLRYLGRAFPTDVMAFELGDKPDTMLADIIVSADTAVSNSRIFKTGPLYELCLYIVHGMLHLLGYDDRTPKERRLMNRKAKDILKYAHTQDRSHSFK